MNEFNGHLEDTLNAKELNSEQMPSLAGGRAIAFDLDSQCLLSLREALPDWEIEEINGATTASLSTNWNPAAANIIVLKAREGTETHSLHRFLANCLGYAKDFRQWKPSPAAPSTTEQCHGVWKDVPLLILMDSKDDYLREAALQTGPQSWLMFPIHLQHLTEIFSRLSSVSPGGQVSVGTEVAERMDRWADDGGQ